MLTDAAASAAASDALAREILLTLRSADVRQFRKLVTAPNYDRRSPWMRVAADRHRFERQAEKLLRPMLMRKQMEILCKIVDACVYVIKE